jgi:hypothetical protein
MVSDRGAQAEAAVLPDAPDPEPDLAAEPFEPDDPEPEDPEFDDPELEESEPDEPEDEPEDSLAPAFAGSLAGVDSLAPDSDVTDAARLSLR